MASITASKPVARIGLESDAVSGVRLHCALRFSHWRERTAGSILLKHCTISQPAAFSRSPAAGPVPPDLQRPQRTLYSSPRICIIYSTMLNFEGRSLHAAASRDWHVRIGTISAMNHGSSSANSNSRATSEHNAERLAFEPISAR